MQKLRVLNIILLAVGMALLNGCGDESLEEMEQRAEQEVAQEMAEQFGDDESFQWDEDHKTDDSHGSYEYSEIGGSSGSLDGTVAVVTILVDDAVNVWDIENSQKDQQTFDTVYNDVKIGCEWITKACAEYGRDVSFVWDWDQHEELIYDVSVNGDASKDDNGIYDEIQSFIRADIDSEGIKKSLGANGIIYLACVNTPPSNTNTSMTRMWEYYNPIYEEVCLMRMYCDGELEPPSCFAHEMLHTFGAADLYEEGMYGITSEYVEYAESINLNDIMRTNDDPKTESYVYDRIPNKITDITAYYIGLTDHSETVDEWGFEPSQYAYGE